MEKTEIRGLSLEELEGQHVELLPERIEMRRRRRRGLRQDCDSAAVNTSILPINLGGQNAICLDQRG
jgi:hypothetical protein